MCLFCLQKMRQEHNLTHFKTLMRTEMTRSGVAGTRWEEVSTQCGQNMARPGHWKYLNGVTKTKTVLSVHTSDGQCWAACVTCPRHMASTACPPESRSRVSHSLVISKLCPVRHVHIHLQIISTRHSYKSYQLFHILNTAENVAKFWIVGYLSRLFFPGKNFIWECGGIILSEI